MREGRRSMLRSPAVLIVAFVTILGLTGLVTAAWFADAPIQGQVNTGGVGLNWADAGTNDDGIVENDSSGSDTDGFDPREGYPWGSSLARYDLDVAFCQADSHGDHLQFWIDNGYPSYFCTVEGTLGGADGVPVMTMGAEYAFTQHVGFIPEWDGPTCWSDNGTPENGDDDFEYAETAEGFGGDCEGEGSEYNPGDGDFMVEPQFADFDVTQTDDMLEVYDFEGDHVMTVWVSKSCGDLVNPGEPNPDAAYKVTVHVESDADPHTSYQMEVWALGMDANSYVDECVLNPRS